MFTLQAEQDMVSYKTGNREAHSSQHFVALFLVDTEKVSKEQQKLKEKGTKEVHLVPRTHYQGRVIIP